jgi:PhnB protein
MAVKPIPDGYHAVTPYMVVNNCERALEFYKNSFGASEIMRMPGPDGKIMHAEIKIGDSIIMLADEFPERGARSPVSFGGSPVSLMLYVKDVDATFNKAVGAGSTVQQPVKDQFYGDRSGTIVDPFGHVWTLSTHVEDVAPEEMQKRMEAMSHENTSV